MRWFKRKTEVPFKIEAVDVKANSFPMHILGLNPSTGYGPLSIQLKSSPSILVPTIIKDGLETFLHVSNERAYLQFQESIRNRVLQLPHSHLCYMGVATGVCLDPSIPALDALPYEVVGFSQPCPELEKIFHTLQLLTSFPNEPSLGVDLFNKAKSELRKEPLRIWINTTLEDLEHKLNWTRSIVSQVEGYKRQHGLA